MTSNPVRCFRKRTLLAATSVLLGPLLIPVTASAAEYDGKAMPFDLPVSARELKSGHRPVLSRSGHLLAYTVGERPITSSGADRFMSNGVPGQIPDTALWLVDLVSGETKAIGQGAGNCWRPVFSPDEKSIASYCDGGDAPQLWIHDLASGKSRRISEARIKASLWTGDEPIWLPGGEQLLAPLAPVPLSAPVSTSALSGALPESRLAATVTFQTTGGASPGAAPVPDASAIALAKHVETLFHADLAAIDVAGGRVRTIVSHDYAKPPSAMLLSPSGRWISFISHVGNETGGARPNIDLGVAPVGGGAAKLVAERLTRMEPHYLKGSHFWHPARDEIFWVQDGGLWSARADDGFAPHCVSAKLSTAIPDALGLMNDGTALVVGIDPLDDPAYLEPHPGAFEVVRLGGGAGRRIEIPSGFLADNLVRDGDGRLWQPDANSVAVRAREKATGKTAVLRLDIVSGAASTIWRDFATIDPVGQVRGSHDLFAIYENNSTPEDIIRFNPDLSIKQRVSHVEPRLDGFTFAPPVMFDTPVNRLDGAGNSVKSALYLPPGAKRGDRLPTVVTVYPRSTTRVGRFGGGFPQTMPASIFTTRGYAVLVTELPVRPLGAISPSLVDDIKGLLTPQIRHASDLGYVDMSRLAVMGQSFGGYTTASLLIESDMFRGGIALAGAYDLTYLTAFMGKNRDFGYPPGAIERYWNIKGLPWANMDSYIKLSPFFQAGRMQAPILIAHGSNDLIPIEDARKMFNALRFAGKTAEFAEYAGEAHVPSHWSTANAADLGRRAIEFLDRYVKPVREPAQAEANATRRESQPLSPET